MARFETRSFGSEGQTLVVVDDFSDDPHSLRDIAARTPFVPALHAYPGMRGMLPASYWPGHVALLMQAAQMLGVADAEPALIDASFSIVTTPRESLSVAQRLPHCDAHDHERVAFVHYLDPTEATGGTAFFRHRSTGFEIVDRMRAPIFDGQLDAELRHGRPLPSEYVDAENRLFERIGMVPARYNRAVVYRSFGLHSGVIPPDASLTADPSTGRLTVTGFLAFG